jgi:dUTP pyrophosphatase
MPAAIELCVKRVDRELPLPEYAYPGDAGLDLRSTIDCCLAPGQRAMIPTGLQLAIPDGFAGFVLPRSGMAARHGLSLVNTPGLIDSQYRGEIVLIAINLDGDAPVEIKRGDRLAQLVILPVPKVVLTEVDEFADTERNEKGFGSSGAG